MEVVVACVAGGLRRFEKERKKTTKGRGAGKKTLSRIYVGLQVRRLIRGQIAKVSGYRSCLLTRKYRRWKFIAKFILSQRQALHCEVEQMC